MYDNAHENGSDNRDFGDLTKMKETIDLQQFPFAENEKKYYSTMVTFHLICGYVSGIKLFLITFQFNLFSMELLT